MMALELYEIFNKIDEKSGRSIYMIDYINKIRELYPHYLPIHLASDSDNPYLYELVYGNNISSFILRILIDGRKFNILRHLLKKYDYGDVDIILEALSSAGIYI